MSWDSVQKRLPRPLRRWILRFEADIEDAVAGFSSALPDSALVLDAGAGEGQYANWFRRQRYVGVDLGVGGPSWNYTRLDCVADLSALPFAGQTFDACLNIVTLEHVREPAQVLAELARVVRPGGRLLLVVPQDWEVHQAPHDYYRYTRHGILHLLEKAGFAGADVRPSGGYFRLLSRRLLNGLQFFPGVSVVLAALLLVPPALLLPWLDGLDKRRDFTLGYLCLAQKPS